MLFHELEIGSRFRWRGEVWTKIKSSHAQRETDGVEEFVPSHDHVIRADFQPENNEADDDQTTDETEPTGGTTGVASD